MAIGNRKVDEAFVALRCQEKKREKEKAVREQYETKSLDKGRESQSREL